MNPSEHAHDSPSRLLRSVIRRPQRLKSDSRRLLWASTAVMLMMSATACEADRESGNRESHHQAKSEAHVINGVKTNQVSPPAVNPKGRHAPAPLPVSTATDEPAPDTQASRRSDRASVQGIDATKSAVGSGRLGTPAQRKTAYLTFDDGPSGSTQRILSILRRYGVKATFFVVGATSEEGKELYKRIVSDGHALGNHTFSHDYRSVYRSKEAFRDDVDKLNRLLEETTGRTPDILRFPGGSNNKVGSKFGGAGIMSRIVSDMRARGYQFFDWNVSSTDAAAPVQERDMIVSSVLEAARGKCDAIVLMHDNTRKKTTVEALPAVIEGLKHQGFAFDVLRRSSYSFHFLEPD